MVQVQIQPSNSHRSPSQAYCLSSEAESNPGHNIACNCNGWVPCGFEIMRPMLQCYPPVLQGVTACTTPSCRRLLVPFTRLEVLIRLLVGNSTGGVLVMLGDWCLHLREDKLRSEMSTDVSTWKQMMRCSKVTYSPLILLCPLLRRRTHVARSRGYAHPSFLKSAPLARVFRLNRVRVVLWHYPPYCC